ncbi:T9SS C-terminal target domain-containing protein [Rhodohalobacter sp. SW132]|uniref:T9SS type A sorting domain-containing protein n=1 Tax=Rhodohalobacter sp. SW132 TaxID=2293433 RepID=UPI000E233ABE|nr:T9SS type A sorting domain-containing protein [Rhodohalobacter sp. SW132]REL38136.1 T9SS C-terminal target domain-containing protein [Rhodohalobacter sp. SW132]
MIRFLLALLLITFFPVLLFSQTPQILDEDLTIQAITEVPFEAVKLSYNHQDETLYLLTQPGDIYSVDIENGQLTEVQNSSDHGLEDVQGFDISYDGRFFIVGNIRNNSDFTNIGVIKRAEVVNGAWEWSTVAESEPYPLSNTFFDHVMNGVVVSPDGQMLYVNSGSRTDHGEVHSVDGRYPGLREAPLTAIILQLPADGEDIILENDRDILRDNGYLYAEGTRNSFSLAFNTDGKLFAADNAGERDDPEELNWLREGHHYGFPWVMGGNQNPMQFEGYVPEEDLLLPTETGSYHYFYDDPDFPAPPEGVEFTAAIPNFGPDAVNYRDPETGEILRAFDEDTTITSFTGHKSVLGLVFDTTSTLQGNYKGDAFALGFTGHNIDAYLLSHMDEIGEDLLHLQLTETDGEAGYTLTSTRIAQGFTSPVDAELIDNKLYVVEHKNPHWLNPNATTRIWEITFPGLGTSVDDPVAEIATDYKLNQNYPNPFNPSTTISYNLPENSMVRLEVFDMAGRRVAELVNGRQSAGSHQAEFDASKLSSGVYHYRLRAGEMMLSRQMVLVK